MASSQFDELLVNQENRTWTCDLPPLPLPKWVFSQLNYSLRFATPTLISVASGLVPDKLYKQAWHRGSRLPLPQLPALNWENWAYWNRTSKSESQSHMRCRFANAHRLVFLRFILRWKGLRHNTPHWTQFPTKLCPSFFRFPSPVAHRTYTTFCYVLSLMTFHNIKALCGDYHFCDIRQYLKCLAWRT